MPTKTFGVDFNDQEQAGARGGLIVGALGMTGAQGAETATAIFAGGCSGRSRKLTFDHAPGVISTTSGYIGGHVDKLETTSRWSPKPPGIARRSTRKKIVYLPTTPRSPVTTNWSTPSST